MATKLEYQALALIVKQHNVVREIQYDAPFITLKRANGSAFYEHDDVLNVISVLWSETFYDLTIMEHGRWRVRLKAEGDGKHKRFNLYIQRRQQGNTCVYANVDTSGACSALQRFCSTRKFAELWNIVARFNAANYYFR